MTKIVHTFVLPDFIQVFDCLTTSEDIEPTIMSESGLSVEPNSPLTYPVYYRQDISNTCTYFPEVYFIDASNILHKLTNISYHASQSVALLAKQSDFTIWDPASHEEYKLSTTFRSNERLVLYKSLEDSSIWLTRLLKTKEGFEEERVYHTHKIPQTIPVSGVYLRRGIL